MSLINPKLPDLEERRAGENQHAAAHSACDSRFAGRGRWLVFIVISLGLLWFCMKVLPVAVAGAVLLPEMPLVAAEFARPAKISDQQRSGVVPISNGNLQASDSSIVLKQSFTGGAKDVVLRQIGVVEGIDAVRLLFEFSRRPDYQVSTDPQNPHSLTLLFFATAQGNLLEIPPLRGSLLQALELAAVKQGLQLRVGMVEPGRLQTYALPADATHGERLLVEISSAGSPPAHLSAAAVSAGTGQVETLGAGTDPSQQVDVLSRQAQRFLEQGDVAAAKIKLRQVLDLTPANVALRRQLVDLLLGDQQQEEAETLLLAGLMLAPQDPALRTRYGRLLFDRNQLTEALALMLAKPIPALSEQPEYHILLATLEQESGRFANAATRYRELVRLRPEQAEWWLLLAITYEQLNDARQAGNAYQQALATTGLSPEHRQFSLERLERLQRLQ